MRFWAAPRSLVATYGISVDFFSSGYLDISVPRVRSVHLCIQCTVPPKRWVSPFGHCRIKACCQLPDTFRRLPRPSSPLTAKASTVYAWSLDHITPSRLGADPLQDHAKQRIRCLNLFRHISVRFRTKTLVTRLRFQRTPRRPQRRLASINLCVRCYTSKKRSCQVLVEPVGIEPTTPCLQSRCSPS